ncbi:MAG: NAD(P)H-hydrate epimerase, partial [Bacteroidota bacterium]
MRIPSAAQIRALDEATTFNEGISSTSLMERASRAFVRAFRKHYGPERPVAILCGTGNNGGDGLVVARQLMQHYHVIVVQALIGERSPDNAINYRRVAKAGIKIHEVKPLDPFPKFSDRIILIDALFGTGLSRPLRGYWADFVEHFNEKGHTTIALDLPSGMFADAPSVGPVLKAERTISLGLPKMALFAPENTHALGEWEIAHFRMESPELVDHYLREPEALEAYLIEAKPLAKLVKRRSANDHKGNFGHALLLAGSF